MVSKRIRAMEPPRRSNDAHPQHRWWWLAVIAFAAAAIWPIVEVAATDSDDPLQIRAVPIEIGNRLSSFGDQPEKFRKTPVAQAAARAGVSIAPSAQPALAHGFRQSRLFYLFYNDVVNVPADRYLVQRIRRTKKYFSADGQLLRSETQHQVEAFKSLDGRIKRPDQHFGSYALGSAYRRVVIKEFEVGLADVSSFLSDTENGPAPERSGEVPDSNQKTGDEKRADEKPADKKPADEKPAATTEPTKTAWPFSPGILFKLIQPYQDDAGRYDDVEFHSSVRWRLEVSFDRQGNYQIDCPELQIHVQQRLPSTDAAAADWAQVPSSAQQRATAQAAASLQRRVVDGETALLREAVGLGAVHLGNSHLQDVIQRWGRPSEVQRARTVHHAIFADRHLKLSFAPDGPLRSLSTLPGFTGLTSQGARHGDSGTSIVARYGPPQSRTKRNIIYPGIIFWLDASDCVETMVVWRRPNPLNWRTLADYPDPHGVAGPIVGVHNGVLLVAGGANFPDGVPWHPTADGGKSTKHYSAHCYALPDAQQGTDWIKQVDLPHPVAYSVSVSTPHGILSFGGERTIMADGEATLSRESSVFRVAWNAERERAETHWDWPVDGEPRRLPQLPRGITAACGALVGDYVYLAGGDGGEGGSGQFLRLHLKPSVEQLRDGQWQWETLPTWPGPPRSHAIAVSQADKFFLLSGRNKLPDADFQLFYDAYVFDPSERGSGAEGWQRLPDVSAGNGPVCVMAGIGIGHPTGQLTVIGGAAGDILLKRESEIPQAIAAARAAGDSAQAERLLKQANDLYDFHRGFSRDVLRFDLAAKRWSKVGELPVSGPVTTTAVRWGTATVLPSGERSPGVRTRTVWLLEDGGR